MTTTMQARVPNASNAEAIDRIICKLELETAQRPSLSSDELTRLTSQSRPRYISWHILTSMIDLIVSNERAFLLLVSFQARFDGFGHKDGRAAAPWLHCEIQSGDAKCMWNQFTLHTVLSMHLSYDLVLVWLIRICGWGTSTIPKLRLKLPWWAAASQEPRWEWI